MMRIYQSLIRHRLRILLLLLVLVSVSFAGLWKGFAAGLEGPRVDDRHVTHVVTYLMVQEHLSKHPLDDEISRRGFKSLLNNFDRLKLFFNQSDIDEFSKNKTDLDDMLKKKDVSFVYTVYNRFMVRLESRVNLVDELLAQKLDFSLDEEIISDPDLSSYALNDAEARDRWRRRLKYELLQLKADKIEGKEAREKLSRRYHSLLKRWGQTDQDELLEMFLTSMTTSFDPHTTYMSKSTLENFRIMMRLKLEGIGAALKLEDGYTVVSKIIPGGAADKNAQLKVEDRVVSVGQGESGEMVDVVDMKLNDVVHLIRGSAGTIVRLGVLSGGGSENKIIKITRAKIELKDSEARGKVIDSGKKSDGSSYRIGVIDLPSFYMDMEAARNNDKNYKSTTRDVRKILDTFNEQGVDAVVLDLRRNGGGSLTEAINLTGLFIDQGPVVQVKDPDGHIQQYDDLSQGMAWDGPLLILTSKFSASASEILAGAIQDYRRGLIVGDVTTHGKGTVQSLLDLGEQLFKFKNPPRLGALKITMQQFYRPNGDSTQKRGVVADLALPSVTTHMDVGEGDLDYALEFDRIKKADYERYNMVDADLKVRLRDLSISRRQQSKDFSELAVDIKKYREQKSIKRFSINEKKFFERRKEFDAKKQNEKQFEDQQNSDNEIFKTDHFYNKEVISIALDYLTGLGSRKIAQTN